MFDFDISKLMVVAIVALAVIPPKDLPRVMRTVGQVLGKMRRMAAEFQGQFMDAMREADLENVRKELEALNEKAKVDASFDPAAMIRDEVTKAATPREVGTSEVSLDPPELAGPPPETPAKIGPDLEKVGKEPEALNERAGTGAFFDGADATKAAAPHEIGASEVALKAAGPAPPTHERPFEVEAPAAKQSAAE